MIWGKRRPRAACAEARDAALFGPADAAAEARVQRHVAHCAACQAQQRRLDATRADLVATDVPLDDLTRARMLDRLSGRLDDLAASGARGPEVPSRVRGRWLATGALVAAACTVVLVFWSRGWIARPMPGSAPVATTPPAPAAVPSPSHAPSRSPSLAAIHIDSGEPARDHLIVAAGARTRARLGEHTRFVLIGPAALHVLAARADLLELRLDRGTLVAEHDHASRRQLRIQSPHTATEIVGTTFLIEAGAGRSRVAVAQGRVLVRNDRQDERIVAAGQTWSTVPRPPDDSPAPTETLTPSPPEITRLFLREVPGTSPPQEVSVPSSPGGRTRAAPVRPAPPPPVPPLAMAPPPAALPSAPPPPAATLTPPPTPTPPPPAPPAPPPPPDAAALYRLAEQAMARGDDRQAAQHLEQLGTLPATGARDPLIDLARFELAQRSLRAGDLPAARRWVQALDGGGPLAEPAQLFACDLDQRAGATQDARRCYEGFRALHPGSVQDAEALGALITLMPTSEACAAGRALVLEYLARYPEGPRAALARRLRAECPR